MKIVAGKVHGTGLPIDGYVLRFIKYRGGELALWGWDPNADAAVIETVFRTETEAGICLYSALDDFRAAWLAGKWEPQGAFCVPENCVDFEEDYREGIREN